MMESTSVFNVWTKIRKRTGDKERKKNLQERKEEKKKKVYNEGDNCYNMCNHASADMIYRSTLFKSRPIHTANSLRQHLEPLKQKPDRPLEES